MLANVQTVLTVDQARAQFAELVECYQATEMCALDDALLRVVAQDVYSPINVPPSDNSAMDGFAVAAKDITSVPIKLPVSQRIAAGQVGEKLEPGHAARIFTGASIPAGANAVVIQENCDYADELDSVTINCSVSENDNIRPAGQDIAAGALVIKKGQRLSAIDLGLLASVGVSELSVYKPLTIGLFSTGDELVAPGQPLKPGQIYNSNRSMLKGVCKQLGFEVIDCGIVDDTLNATKQALQNAAAKADVIISSGGVSVGEEDYIRPALEAAGEIAHWKVQMKPGKPVVIGKIHDTPFIGLPGNPVSSFIVLQLLALPMLQTLQGQYLSELKSIPVRAVFNKAEVSREEFIRVQIKPSDSALTAQLFSNQSSGVLFSLAWADGLVRQRIGQSIAEGDTVEFLPLNEGLL